MACNLNLLAYTLMIWYFDYPYTPRLTCRIGPSSFHTLIIPRMGIGRREQRENIHPMPIAQLGYTYLPYVTGVCRAMLVIKTNWKDKQTILEEIPWVSRQNVNRQTVHRQNVHWQVFLKTIFVSSHMYPENPEGTQIIVCLMNMGYVSDTARTRTRNLFRPKREPIPLGHSDGLVHYKWLS